MDLVFTGKSRERNGDYFAVRIRPAAFFVTERWLRSFAYRIEIGVWPFVLSPGVVLVVVTSTRSRQTVAAALANPADSIRHE